MLAEKEKEVEKDKEKQLKFLEQILKEKEQMSDQYRQLQGQFEDMTHQHARQLKTMEDRLGVEKRRAKDTWMASEKVRRERWEQEKIKDIKKLTI